MLATGVGMLALVLAACGGGSDDESSATTSSSSPIDIATTTVPAATTTTAAPTTTTTTIAYVTEGATVVVANASNIDGAAGRFSDRLAAVGFTMGEATNSSDAIGKIALTQIYYVAGDEPGFAVAQSLQQALGGGDIALMEVGVPAPTASGEMGDATVLVLMGNDVSDKSLEQLQGLAPVTTEPSSTGPDSSSDVTSDSTADSTPTSGA